MSDPHAKHDLVYGGHRLADDLDKLIDNFGGDMSSQAIIEVLRDKLVNVINESGDPITADERRILEAL